MNAYSKTIPTCSQLVNHSSPNSERLREGFILNTDALHITTIQFTPAHNYIRTYPAMHIFTCARIQPCTSSHLNLHISLSYSLSLSLTFSPYISLIIFLFSLRLLANMFLCVPCFLPSFQSFSFELFFNGGFVFCVCVFFCLYVFCMFFVFLIFCMLFF